MQPLNVVHIFNRFYMFFNASSREWPSLMHPGRAGTSTENPPSSLRSSTTVSFFVFLPITSCSIYLVLLSFCDLLFNRRTDPTVFAYHSSPIYWAFFGLQDCEGRSGGGLPDCESGGLRRNRNRLKAESFAMITFTPPSTNINIRYAYLYSFDDQLQVSYLPE